MVRSARTLQPCPAFGSCQSQFQLSLRKDNYGCVTVCSPPIAPLSIAQHVIYTCYTKTAAAARKIPPPPHFAGSAGAHAPSMNCQNTITPTLPLPSRGGAVGKIRFIWDKSQGYSGGTQHGQVSRHLTYRVNLSAANRRFPPSIRRLQSGRQRHAASPRFVHVDLWVPRAQSRSGACAPHPRN